MAFDPLTRSFRDPFGGQADLATGLIRCVGTARARFEEDGLRCLRAVRFAAVLGFALDPATQSAIAPTLAIFAKVSIERVREELNKLLTSARPRLGLELLRSTGLLGAILPELVEGVGQAQGSGYAHDVWGHAVSAVEAIAPQLELRLAALLHDVAKPRTRVPTPTGFDFPEHEVAGEALSRSILERLKYPTRLIEQVGSWIRHHRLAEAGAWSDAQLRRFAARVGEPNLPPLFALVEAGRRARGVDVLASLAQLEALKARLNALLASHPPLSARALALDGKALMRLLGVPPSPIVGEATRFLMDQVFEDPALNTVPGLTGLISKWAKSKGL